MKLTDCHNIDDFRALAKRRLPWPVFDYIDGAADDEVTRRRNRAAFDRCDLIPRVLAGVESIDMKTTLFGREIAMPCSPMRLSSAPTPGSCTSQHRKLSPGRTRAMCAVASPMPKPISRISGASRPNAAAVSSGAAL